MHTHIRMVRMTHRRRALVNLINPTDTSGTNVDGHSVLCRTFHDNAHEVAPPPRDVVVTFVDPGDRARGVVGGREGGGIMRAE